MQIYACTRKKKEKEKRQNSEVSFSPLETKIYRGFNGHFYVYVNTSQDDDRNVREQQQMSFKTLKKNY